MNAERTAHLERILLNRRERGIRPVPLRERLEPPAVDLSSNKPSDAASPPPAQPPSLPPSQPTAVDHRERASPAAAQQPLPSQVEGHSSKTDTVLSPPPATPPSRPTTGNVDYREQRGGAEDTKARLPPPPPHVVAQHDGGSSSRDTILQPPAAAAAAAANNNTEFMHRVAAVIRPKDPSSLVARSSPDSAPTAALPTSALRSTSIGSTPADPPSSLMDDPNALFRRGRFADYRQHPVLVVDASAIKPYRSDRRRSVSGRRRSQSPGVRSEQNSNNLPPVTEDNPFRKQTFAEFLHQPDYSTPPQIEALLSNALKASEVIRNHRNEVVADPAAAIGGPNRAPSPGLQQHPLFPTAEAMQALLVGDWFHKWTRRKEKMHQRFFWLGTDGVLYWAKAPGVFTILSSHIRVSEVVRIDTTTEVDPDADRTYYIMNIWAVSRAVQIATEISGKFDLWYEVLSRISAAYREHNEVYLSRLATMQPVRADESPYILPAANRGD